MRAIADIIGKLFLKKFLKMQMKLHKVDVKSSKLINSEQVNKQ